MIKFERFKRTRKAAQKIVAPAFKNAGELLGAAELIEEGKKINNCGAIIKVLQCENCGNQYFRNFFKCKSKYCPTCAALKGSIWCAKLYPRLQQWLQDGKYVCFATFTIPAQDNLETALETIYNAWRYMTNKLVAKEWKTRFAGGLKSVEIKIGKNSKKWHVHIHALVLRAKYGRDHHFLREAWIKAVQHILGKETIVNMPRIESIKETAKNNKEKDRILAAICETVKYMTKVNTNMTPDQLKECFNLLKGRRQIACWGNLYGLSKTVEKEMEEDSDNQIKSFECECGCTIGHFIELWDNTNTNWQEKELAGNYNEVCKFNAIKETLSNVKSYISEEDDLYKFETNSLHPPL